MKRVRVKRVVVYALRNDARGVVYFGSSRDFERRERAWRWSLRLFCEDPTLPCPVMPARFFERAAGGRYEDWFFVVLKEFPEDASENDIFRCEAGHIQAAKDAALRVVGAPVCLNTMARPSRPGVTDPELLDSGHTLLEMKRLAGMTPTKRFRKPVLRRFFGP